MRFVCGFVAYRYVPDFRKEVGDFFVNGGVCESENMDDMLYRGLGHTRSGAIIFAIRTGF